MSPAQQIQDSYRVHRLPIALIRPVPERHYFGHDSLPTLADRMAVFGLIEPIVVRPAGDRYEIVSGLRRWLAAQKLGWRTIDVKIQDDAR